MPVVIGPQEDAALAVILSRADKLSAPAFVFGQDFSAHQEHGRMVYEDEMGLLDLPLPKLIGRHQIENAAVAIAGLRHADGWGMKMRQSKRACARSSGRRACSD